MLFSCTGAEPEEEVAPAEISDSSDELVFKSAVTDTTGNIGAEAGFIADGDKITLPTGFTAEQCVFTAALASVSGSALSQRVAVNKTTAVVTCKTLVQERAEVQPTEKSCTASYTVICAK
ncbi:MAG: hypothetical protein HYT76_08200 [Deltaproteobacteria bacterium]|nr:hypothetical protein [Deltaproteobacteria bacterium]